MKPRLNHNSQTAAALVQRPQYRQRVVRARKGKGSYTRKAKHRND